MQINSVGEIHIHAKNTEHTSSIYHRMKGVKYSVVCRFHDLCSKFIKRRKKQIQHFGVNKSFFLVCLVKVNIKESAVFDSCQTMKREDVKEFLYITTDFRGLFRRLLLHCGVLPQVLCYKDTLSQLYPTFEEAQGSCCSNNTVHNRRRKVPTTMVCTTVGMLENT